MSPTNIFVEQRSNFRHLYQDVFWFGVLAGSGIGFLNLFAARLGASSLEIGLISAAPAVINLIFTLPAGRWLEGRPLIPASFWSSVGQRLGYLGFMLLPWLLNPGLQVAGLVWITLAMSIPGTLLAIAFNAMFADVVPPEKRADVVGKRNALVAISVTLTALLSGQILDTFIFPLNYQIVFGIGSVGALMSSYHLGRLRKSNQPWPRLWGRPRGKKTPADLILPSGKAFLRLDLLRGPFGGFLASFLVFYTFQYLPFPLFPSYLVNNIGLSEGQISLGTAMFHLMMMFGSLWLTRLTGKFGNRWLLAAGGILFAQYPLMIALARDATLFWVTSIAGGLIFSVLNGGLINRLMERVPEDDRPAHMAFHNLALNLGVLIGSLVGPLLGGWLGLQNALFASAALRFAAGFLLILWG